MVKIFKVGISIFRFRVRNFRGLESSFGDCGEVEMCGISGMGFFFGGAPNGVSQWNEQDSSLRKGWKVFLAVP